eukprot:11114951-Lingulodinium_polyedra.AAC.1
MSSPNVGQGATLQGIFCEWHQNYMLRAACCVFAERQAGWQRNIWTARAYGSRSGALPQTTSP